VNSPGKGCMYSSHFETHTCAHSAKRSFSLSVFRSSSFSLSRLLNSFLPLSKNLFSSSACVIYTQAHTHTPPTCTGTSHIHTPAHTHTNLINGSKSLNPEVSTPNHNPESFIQPRKHKKPQQSKQFRGSSVQRCGLHLCTIRNEMGA